MGNPYVGEIRLFGGNFAPLNWHFCDGTLIAISDNATLFNLIGTTYGGDGVQTFGLPDMRSRVPMHWGTPSSGGTYVIGQLAGTETVTLLASQMPSHSHQMQASNTGSALSPSGNLPAVTTSTVGTCNIYGPAAVKATTLSASSIAMDGQSLPHNNLQPYLAVSFIISLYGIYPSQS